MTEREILEALARQEPAGIKALYEQHKDELMRFLDLKGAIVQDAEDVLMDVVCALIIRLSRRAIFIQPGKLAGFLKRAVWFQYCSFLRRKNPAAPGVTFPKLERLPSAEEKDFQLEIERYVLLRESRAKLNKGCQDLITLHYNEKELLKAIAPKKNWTYGYTRKKHGKCLAQLLRIITADPRYKDLYD